MDEIVKTSISELSMIGRAPELRIIADSLDDDASGGILIEGDAGMGKTLLAGEIHRRRGGEEPWLRADRVLTDTPFGAFGLLVDLNADPRDLIGRIIAALAAEGTCPAVFVDDAHHLDRHSIRVLSQLAADGSIKLVVMSRQVATGGYWPFADLVDEGMIDQLGLGPLSPTDLRTAIEQMFGGIASQGVIDLVDQHSGRNPGKLIELLSYAQRKQRFVLRDGVLLLDGLDIDFDDRARDFARIDLDQYPPDQREAFELVAMAGEVEVETMLSLGLGSAADLLVEVGGLLVRTRRENGREEQIYVIRSSHSSETIRHTMPMGRSRTWYSEIAERSSEPSPWAQMLRAEWGKACGIVIDERAFVDAAITAVRFGEWHRAARLLAGVSTDTMGAAELYALACLYCNVGNVHLGFDVLAQCLRKADNPGIVLAAAVLWANRVNSRASVAVGIADFRAAFERIETREECFADDEGSHRGEPIPTGFEPIAWIDGGPSSAAREKFGARPITVKRAQLLFDALVSPLSARRRPDSAALETLFADTDLPDNFRMEVALILGSLRLEAGRPNAAAAVLKRAQQLFPARGLGSLTADMLEAKSYLDRDDIVGARQVSQRHPTLDIAYITARSGTRDLVNGEIQLRDGDWDSALRSFRAAVAAVDHCDQSSLRALALGMAEYAAVFAGDLELADDYHRRFAAIAPVGHNVEYRRARAHVLAARWKRTSDARDERQLRDLLADAELHDEFRSTALIRFFLFWHFSEVDAQELIRISHLGEGKLFDLLGIVGTAVRDRDMEALSTMAAAMPDSLLDLKSRCFDLIGRSLDRGTSERASNCHFAGEVTLTDREREISGLIVNGFSNRGIADQLGVTARTVEGHTYRLYRKLGVKRRSQVADALDDLNISLRGAAV